MTYPVTVVIPSFNRPELLEHTLNFIAAAEPAEIIVVDDASEAIHAYQEAAKSARRANPHATIKLIRNKSNLGASRAREVGALSAQEKYILFLDDDILIDKNYLKIATEALERHPMAAVSTGNTKNIESSIEIEKFEPKSPSSSTPEGITENHSKWTMRLSPKKILRTKRNAYVLFGWNPLMWRQAAIKEGQIEFVNYIGNGYREETDPQIQAWRNGWKVLYVNELYAFHVGRKNDGGQWGNGKWKNIRWYLSAIKNNRVFLERHGDYLRERKHLRAPKSIANLIFAASLIKVIWS